MFSWSSITQFALAHCKSTVAVLVAIGTPSLVVPARAQTDVDLKLVLAVDISMSMDPDEQKLQREGYVEAFRDPAVQKAIASGPKGRIAVTYFEWAGPTIQNVLIPWRVISSPESADQFAADLLAKPTSRFSRTSISAALVYARGLLNLPDYRAARQVIDVSGDGVNNSGPLMAEARASTLAQGIVINGLPILVKPTANWSAWDAPNLDIYYANCVVGGPSSFSLPILASSEFKTATRQKLLLEIATIDPPAKIWRAQTPPAQAQHPHCAEVERRIEKTPRYYD